MGTVDVGTAFYTEEEQKEYEKKNEEIHFKTNFGFLASHNGLRKNKLHLLLAPTGVGKSTIVRGLCRDIIFGNKDKTVIIWLTEETRTEFITQLSYGLPAHDILNNIIIFSEQDNRGMSDVEIYKTIKELSDDVDADFVIMDNLTTSKIYNAKQINEQTKVCDALKDFVNQNDLGLFVIAHTGAQVRENQLRLIDENDIKGAKYLTTIVEFLYILQPVFVNQTLHQFLKIKKHRGQELIHSLFYLVYDRKTKTIKSDVSKNYSDFTELFKQRNQLK